MLLYNIIQVFFDGYNKRYKSDSTHAILDWTECNERVETFKREHIYKNIIETEIEDMSYPHLPIYSL